MRYSGARRESFALHGGLALPLTLWRTKLQADSRHGLDQARARTIIAEFAPQSMDRYAHDITGGCVVVSPYVAHERLRRDDRIAATHQTFEEAKLGPGQAQRLAVDNQ